MGQLGKMQDTINKLEKYKYAALVVLLGILLISFPVHKKEEPVPEKSEAVEAPMELRLADILSKIEGVGKAEVLLSTSSGEEKIYQENEKESSSESSASHDRAVVTVTDAGRAENGLIRQVIPPQYRGAVVICQGGARPDICLAVKKAVADITGLGLDRISVLKMK